jgi:CheY-like chemotaxis protein
MPPVRACVDGVRVEHCAARIAQDSYPHAGLQRASCGIDDRSLMHLDVIDVTHDYHKLLGHISQEVIRPLIDCSPSGAPQAETKILHASNAEYKFWIIAGILQCTGYAVQAHCKGTEACRTRREKPVPSLARRVLVIDDEDAVRDLLEYGLGHAGFAERSVSNGHDALKLIGG